MEAKGDSLPGPLAAANPGEDLYGCFVGYFKHVICPGKKGGRKDEQYRLMFAELERMVQAQSVTSARHHSVLECLMEVSLPLVLHCMAP